MARTYNRQPLTVSGRSTYDRYFTHSSFKGMCDDKNDVTIDPMTYSSVDNMYIDDDGILTSRPPLKFNDEHAYILQEWTFDEYTIRFCRTAEVVRSLSSVESVTFRYFFYCTTHDIDGVCFTVDGQSIQGTGDDATLVVHVGWDEIPEVHAQQIEDKIYFWFAGYDFFCLNTSKNEFEDAVQYIYVPVTNLYTNDISSTFESPNFLTSSYRERHQLSTLSSVNLASLDGKSVTVSYLTGSGNSSKTLYTTDNISDAILLHPFGTIGNNSEIIDMKTSSSGVNVYLRKDTFADNETRYYVSFNGLFYRQLPSRTNMIGEPQLTDDAMYVMWPSNRSNYSVCKLVPNETSDFYAASNVLVWEDVLYNKDVTSVISGTIIPTRVFFHAITNDVYCMIIDDGTNRYYKLAYGQNATAGAFTPTTDGEFADVGAYVNEDSILVAVFATYRNSDTVNKYTFFGYDGTLIYVSSEITQTGYVLPCSDIFLGGDRFIRAIPNAAGQNYAIVVLNTAVIVTRDSSSISVSLANYTLTHSGPATYITIPAMKFSQDGQFLLTPVEAINTSVASATEDVYVPSSLEDVSPVGYVNGSFYYTVGAELWTSDIARDDILNLDVTVAGELTPQVPTHSQTLDETCFSYSTIGEVQQELIEITKERYNELQIEAGIAADRLLYLPKTNEQLFTGHITNLHLFSSTIVGVFTESSIWYITQLSLNDGTTVYTRPTKSKFIFGCREGTDVMTALDGKSILLPTERGIAVIAPEAFVATEDQSVVYISDAIQDTYTDFYTEPVENATLTFKQDGFDYDGSTDKPDVLSYDPMIKIKMYRYWILFHRYMDTTILAYDTRNASWWKWETQYPIKQLTVDNRLRVIMQLDYSPIIEGSLVYPTTPLPLMGVEFLWTDDECAVLYDKGDFPTIEDNRLVNIGYYDDTVESCLNGKCNVIYENEYIGYRMNLHYANERIDWHFVSQKLFFSEGYGYRESLCVNKYKKIREIVLAIKGTRTMTAKMSTKAFRDNRHPEASMTKEISVNDLRTFVQRINIMKVVCFQYRIENDVTAELPRQFKLDNLSIKYEVKEMIR